MGGSSTPGDNDNLDNNFSEVGMRELLLLWALLGVLFLLDIDSVVVADGDREAKRGILLLRSLGDNVASVDFVAVGLSAAHLDADDRRS